jgi:hypothetical protein
MRKSAIICKSLLKVKKVFIRKFTTVEKREGIKVHIDTDVK